MKHKLISLTALAASTLLAGASIAGGPVTTTQTFHPYVYGGAGITVNMDADTSHSDDVVSSFGTGTDTITESSDKNNVGFTLFGGYQFSKYLAMQLNVSRLGKVKLNRSSQTAVVLGDVDKSTTQYWLTDLDAVASLPCWGHIHLLAKAGMTWAHYTINASTVLNFGPFPAASTSSKDTSNRLIYNYGLGLGLSFNNFMVAANMTRYSKLNEQGVVNAPEVFSGTVSYRFFT